MSSALRFSEQMSGYVAFGDQPHRTGYQKGREQGTRLRLHLRVVVDDVDRFIVGPERRALLRGTARFDELGGEFAVERGELRLLPGGPDARKGRMYYCIGLRGRQGEPLTVRGYKQLEDGRGNDSWTDLTSLKTRVLYEEPQLDRTEDQVDDDERERTIATGILRLTAPALLAGLGSFRPKARSRLAGGIAVARFWAAVAGGIADVYLPRVFEPEDTGEPAVPGPSVALPAGTPAEVVDDDRSPKLQRAVRPFKAGRRNGSSVALEEEPAGAPHLDLQHFTSPDVALSKGPVLLVAGSSVGADIFRPDGVSQTIVHRLVAEGYDVWVENWRASLGQSPREYTLDEAAALDHPQAVHHILKETGSPDIKALVHCLGSSSFMLGLASGLMPEVTHVVSNAVSLHPVVPRGAELKIRSLSSVLDRVMPWWDPQWARDAMTDTPVPGAPTPAERNGLTEALVEWVRWTHNECESDVCNFGNFMYGSGRSTLYDEGTLEPITRKWMENQLSWAPMRLYRQMARSLVAGHLVPMREWDEDSVRGDLFETGPPADMKTRITFITGTENRTFSPRSQERTYEWFSRYHGDEQHAFWPLEGYGHLDVWLREDSSRPGSVFDKVVDGLKR
jgi:hypothetical protein